jgi:hypothetical protein
MNLANFIFFFPSSLLATKNLQNQFFLEILILNFAFWRDFSRKKTAAQTTCPPARAIRSIHCVVEQCAFLPLKIVSGSSAQKFATKSFAPAPDLHTDAMRRHLSEKPTTFFSRFYFVIFVARALFFKILSSGVTPEFCTCFPSLLALGICGKKCFQRENCREHKFFFPEWC